LRPRLLIVASEAVPYAKTGGLGDVISPMAGAIARLGVQTCLLLPAYPCALRQANCPREVARLDDLPGGPGRLLQTALGDVTVLLLQTARFDGREGLYVDAQGVEYADNPVRFADLAHAADRICAGETPLPAPHAVHLHDWHTALMPMIQRARGRRATPSVLTIHNLAFQGSYPFSAVADLGLGDAAGLADQAEFWGRFSFLKAGIRFAAKLSTVSHSYAQEILTPRHGCGMQDVLRERESDLVAVANGIDTACWSPGGEHALPAAFSAADLSGKSVCKKALQAAFGLADDPHAILLAQGSRLTHQKMADVALQALPAVLAAHPRLQLVVHGCGEHRYEEAFERLAAEHDGRVGVRIGYEERLAHLLHAGADLLLHGSRFEPFGLTPIYAMRHGTVPIASRVGGMRDTIVDAGDAAVPNAMGTGVLFDGEEADDMVRAIERALEIAAHPRLRQVLQKNGMARDCGWSRPADAYIELYASLLEAQEAALFREAARPAIAQPAADEPRAAAPLARRRTLKARPPFPLQSQGTL
jgi:starch synthase